MEHHSSRKHGRAAQVYIPVKRGLWRIDASAQLKPPRGRVSTMAKWDAGGTCRLFLSKT
jgi:hypothetical protein